MNKNERFLLDEAHFSETENTIHRMGQGICNFKVSKKNVYLQII